LNQVGVCQRSWFFYRPPTVLQDHSDGEKSWHAARITVSVILRFSCSPSYGSSSHDESWLVLSSASRGRITSVPPAFDFTAATNQTQPQTARALLCDRFPSPVTHTDPFNGPLSRTTQVSRYRKGKANLDITEARDSEWQWHQLGHMQVCTSLQTENHGSTPPLSFFTGRMPFLPPNQ